MTQQQTDYAESRRTVMGGPTSPAPQKSSLWKWLVAAALILVAVVAYYRHSSVQQAKNSGDPSATVRPIMVSTATAKQGDIGVYIDALGTVTPVYTVTVTSRVQGEITKVFYREGQMVRKGDPLLEIDPRPYEAAETQAEGQLAHDEAVLNEAKIDLDRYQQAFNRNAIAKQQLDDQQQVVLQDEGTVKNDQGTLANAKVNLVYTHITSPIDGRVGLRLVDPGNMVQANSSTALVVITQLQPITVIFSVAEDYLSQIQKQLHKGTRLPVDAFDRDQSTKLAGGYLLTLDNVVDPTTGTVKLKAMFDNKDNALFPSQFVNARLLVDTLHNVTLIPTPAIQRNAQGAFSYVIGADQTASIHPITPGVTDGTVTQVQGLDAGAVVATTGFDKLQDGSKVTIRGASGGANGQNAQGGGKTGGNTGAPNGKEAGSGKGNGGKKQGGATQ
jgi:membrane fusion protein, multidrug efflux system